MSRAAVFAAALGLAATTARANVEDGAAGDVTVDWTAGRAVVTVPVHASLRAPTPGMAGEQALRVAEDEAKKRLVAAVGALPWRGTSATVAAEAENADVVERIDDGVVEIATRYGTNGSVVVTRALPLEWVAGLLAPSRAVGAASPAVTSLVVDARHLSKPVFGIELVAGGERYRPPAFFHTTVKPRKDHLGAHPVRARSKAGAAPHELLVDVEEGVLRAAAKSGAIVWVRLRK